MYRTMAETKKAKELKSSWAQLEIILQVSLVGDRNSRTTAADFRTGLKVDREHRDKCKDRYRML